MSLYTTQLRYIVESGYDLGLKDYPIFDESYRETLNNKIIQHFYFREIGLETVALFKVFINRAMKEIMPYYNKLYESANLQYNPLEPYTMVESETANSKSSANGTSGASSRNIYSDTPQSEIEFEAIVNNKYATNASIDETTATTGSNSKGESSANKTTKGNNYYNQSELLTAYRETLLNIDMMIINDKAIQSCFMQIY